MDALATAPINKEALWRAGYRYLGHTEMLGVLTDSPDPLTMTGPQPADLFPDPARLAALTSHAGGGGGLGTEDRDEIAPAVEEARRNGLEVDGPVAADAVFAQALEGRYDAVLALYHDQGHIAAKTLDFHGAVSVTLGLPFIRTSVDHGTAFDIAGKGIARADSLIAAILAAGDLTRRVRIARP